MTAITTGRTLDGGRPVEGTGFEVEPGSLLAELLAERTGPLSSHPTRPVWSAPLSGPEEVDRSVSVIGAGYTGPPEHYHLRSEERFDVRRGTVTFDLDGEDVRVAAGEALTVDTGVVHSFRNDGDEPAIVLTEIHDPGRLRQVLPTLGGLAHDEEANPDDPLQRALIADSLDGNTVFVDGEGPVMERVTEALAPAARLAGYQGAYAKYTQPAFWRRHVEQPEF